MSPAAAAASICRAASKPSGLANGETISYPLGQSRLSPCAPKTPAEPSDLGRAQGIDSRRRRRRAREWRAIYFQPAGRPAKVADHATSVAWKWAN